MFCANFKTRSGHAGLPIDRATLLEGLRLNGYHGAKAINAVNNLSRGIPVIIGECVVQKLVREFPDARF